MVEVTKEDEFKVIVLLLDKRFNESHLNLFSSLFNRKKDVFEDAAFVRAFLFMLKYAPNNDFIDKVLQLTSLVIPHNKYPLRAEFEEFIRTYIGNKPTSLKVSASIG